MPFAIFQKRGLKLQEGKDNLGVKYTRDLPNIASDGCDGPFDPGLVVGSSEERRVVCIQFAFQPSFRSHIPDSSIVRIDLISYIVEFRRLTGLLYRF